MQNSGSSRFATKEEILNDHFITIFDPNAKNVKSGIPVGSEDDKLYIDTGITHSLVIGSTGSGKTQSTVLPLLKSCILANESFLAIDVKGELYARVGGKLKENDYKTIVIDFNNTNRGNHWNPFTLIRYFYNNDNKRKANSMLRLMANQIFSSEKSQDPFWTNNATDYFLGLANILLELGIKDFTLKDLYYLSEYGTKKENGTTFFKKYYAENPGIDSSIFIESILNAPMETMGSIISVFSEKVKKFILDEGLMELMSITDFDITESDFNKTAIFVVLPEFENYKEIYTIFLRQIYEKVINEKDNERMTSCMTFILDDYFKCSPIENLELLLPASRSREIRFVVLLQSIEEIYEMYGKEIGEKVKYQFGNLIYLLSNSLVTLEEISNYCGKDYDANRNLITVEELRTMKQWEAILIKTRQYPFKTYLSPDYKNDWNFDLKDVTIEMHTMNNCRKYDEFVSLLNKVYSKKEVKNKYIPTPNVGKKLDDLINKIDSKIAELEDKNDKLQS